MEGVWDGQGPKKGIFFVQKENFLVVYRVKDNVQCNVQCNVTLPPPPRPVRAISYIVIKCLVLVVHVCQKRMRNLNTESITLFLWVHYIDDILRFQVTN